MRSIYDSSSSKDLSVNSLIEVFKENDINNIYFKALSPNDNSKNQPYLAGHLSDLSFLPMENITASISSSTKSSNRKVKYSAELNFNWISSDNELFPANKTKLIYYPQYPEVRLSGFVSGCGFDMAGWMDPTKKGRCLGRVLILGVTKKKIIAYLATPESRISSEIHTFNNVNINSVIKRISTESSTFSPKEYLLCELKRIHELNWIRSKRIKNNVTEPYTALNGGGYTLEAELGISPNGFSDPDYLGWEIKQFGVKKCHLVNSKALTLMTPEPNGGLYKENGVEQFLRAYGYKNTKIENRIDFTGRHTINELSNKSGLTLKAIGYDSNNKNITDASGCIALVDKEEVIAASWSFTKLMKHWNKKHSKAAYIPSLSKTNNEGYKNYHYCENIRLFEDTNFLFLLQAIATSHVYYDPGIKLIYANANSTIKRRNQFRIKSEFLNDLYKNKSDINLKLI